MKRLYFVEPVVAIYAFAGFLEYPLIQQYVYRRLWKELTNTTYAFSANNSQCATNSSNPSSQHERVQEAASLFSLYTQLFTIIPSLTVTFLLVAYSDQRGRKVTIVLPLVGTLLYTLSFLSVSFFELNIYLLVVASFVSALFGGVGTLLGGCFSYIADLCEDGPQKTLRMAGIDMVIGLLSGVASISTGYFVRAAGFNWPFLTSALFHCVNLLYATFVLGETVTARPEGPSLRRLANGVFQLFAGPGWRRRCFLVLLLLIFTSFCFANQGGLTMVTLYELNQPLCWSEILIGYGMALSTTVFLSSYLGVLVLSRCAHNLLIVTVGLLSSMAGQIMIAFSTTTLMMFLARIPMLLAIMPFPVLRSMMSKVVSKSEQGALFACVACLESLTGNVAVAVFSSVYASTVSWFPGFSFLLGAGLCLIPIALVIMVSLVGPGEAKEVETDSLLPAEEAVATGDGSISDDVTPSA